ncbi:DUF1549 domain-containing protein [Maribacter halichondriae]|uniref:DUF1549 domain-containing protein n=1 Tax=Maribacter halichondriae TaxID=2980554 RepID=UPI002358306D|nr:DUF1549 domain-containing protein [Maribacter sp. Hal144]
MQNEIDGFVLAKLEENNLKPSPKANTETLIRRISLDLTGLPPEREIVQRLVANPSEKVLEKVIDEFLSTPAYGERMTQAWLDLARYADSHGYQDDSYRSMWPWRDWVIHAFNENLPYDEFLTWQLAGDLLPGASKEQILATGFNRNHPITQEGGVIQEEYRTNYVLDRTNTLGKGILGITLECARCHDHKYDPISQKDYFGIFSFSIKSLRRAYKWMPYKLLTKSFLRIRLLFRFLIRRPKMFYLSLILNKEVMSRLWS